MTFPTNISNIFRVIILLALVGQIMYSLNPELNRPDRIYSILLKIAVCFTSVIGYLNDKGKMLKIFEKGILIEEMAVDADAQKINLSFLYIPIAIVYNPVISLFDSNTLWAVVNVGTAIFLTYKIEKRKKV